MEFIGYPEIIFATICFLFLHHLNRNTFLINWPLIGMLPSLLLNVHRLHDWATSILSKTGCTFVFKGPWFTNMANMVVTSDPDDMRHIFNTNFSNYPKGPEFNEIFDILGDGIFNSDLDAWKTQRKVAHQLINHPKFLLFLVRKSCSKVENGLIPVLEHALEQNMVVDLQDVFKRFTFDMTVILLSGSDPGCLGVEFGKFPYLDALDDAEEAVFYRHVLPMSWWKLQRLLGIGLEKRLSQAKQRLDQFTSHCITEKRVALREKSKDKENQEKSIDLLTSYMEDDGVSGPKSDKYLRDTMLNLMVAGRSTVSVALSWFFWLVSENPKVETKIIEEIQTKAISFSPQGKLVKMFNMEELKGLVYLHGSLCEALRLFPSVPFEHKKPVQPDILPSGHKVDSKTKIIPLLYSMGRMERVWGEDCLEFKPERWITKQGGIEYVPSFKFMAFNSGPRTCLGKEIAFTQMKMVAATILFNYHVQILESHSVSPKNSIILYMKTGLNARIVRRF